MDDLTYTTPQVEVTTSKPFFSIEKVFLYIFGAAIFLLPLFFIPSIGASLIFAKFILLAVAVIAGVALWILLRLKDGTFELPMNMIFLSGGLVLAITLISSLLSGSIANSFIGQGFETDTFIFFLLAFVFMFLIPSVFSTKSRIFNLYLVFFTSLGVLALLQFIRLVAGPGVLTLGFLNNITDNLAGKWNDLAILFGLGAVLSLITIELLVLQFRSKVIFYTVLIVSMIFLAIINFTMIWYILGSLALIFFVYSVVMSRSGLNATEAMQVQTRLPLTSFAVLLISVVFILGGSNIGNVISTRLGINQVEVRPTWQATYQIAKNVVFQKSFIRPFFGAGPNRFVNEWDLFRPAVVNNSLFWNTDFNYGIGIIPSSLVTTGILGFLSWLLFLGVLVYMGFRSILSKIPDTFSRYLVTSSFLATMYLWIFAVVYVPSLSVFVLAFVFTGLFIASLHQTDILKPVKLQYFKNPQVGFVSVLVLIIILIAGLGLGYTLVSKYTASTYYQRAVIAINNNNIDSAESLMIKALQLDNNDSYLRGLSQLYLLRLNVLLNSSSTNVPADVARSQFDSYSQKAIQAAGIATTLDKSDYQNWIALGDAYGTIVPYRPEAYDSAVASYQKSFNYNPQNPYIYLQLAKVEAAHKDLAKAKTNLGQALNLKNDYTDAYYLLAQIQIAEGDTKSAINSVTAAAISAQTNPGLFFQLGLLKYDAKDYQNAAAAFEQAIGLNSQYSNAKYFLGLSYYQLNRTDDAIKQFTDIQTLNPDNKEVKDILANLKAGKSPFNGAKAPVTTTQTKTTTKTP